MVFAILRNHMLRDTDISQPSPIRRIGDVIPWEVSFSITHVDDKINDFISCQSLKVRNVSDLDLIKVKDLKMQI